MATASNPTRGTGLRRVPGVLLRIVLALFFAFPIVFMLISSFKPDQQIFKDLGSIRAFLPVGHVSLANYRGVFDRVPAMRFLMNSIVISAVTVALGIVVNSMAAFALSRMRWPGRRLLLTLIIATLIVPFETFALPMVWWVNKLPWLQFDGSHLVITEGWLDTYRVQILPFVANAFSVATVAILTFLPMWNSYLWPLMVVQDEHLRPVMIGIQYFFQLNVSWGQIMAYSTMITVPVLALFLAFQRAFINSIASSGVKG
jgi:multiple sugar transport system permease protein